MQAGVHAGDLRFVPLIFQGCEQFNHWTRRDHRGVAERCEIKWHRQWHIVRARARHAVTLTLMGRRNKANSGSGRPASAAEELQGEQALLRKLHFMSAGSHAC